jgi:hypothetical protein
MANNNNDDRASLYGVSSAQMLRRGLKAIGIDKQTQGRRTKKANVRVYKAHYGVHPNNASAVWIAIITHENENSLPVDKIDLLAFFMSLNFLRCYESEDVRATRFKVDKWKMRKPIWQWIQYIANLKDSIIKYPDAWNTTLVCSVDGTHFRLNEPRHATLKKDPTWYSHKHHCAGHNVQVVMAIWEQQCYNITISKGGTNDKGNVIKSGLLDRLPNGKRAIVDGGYPGDMNKLSGYNQFDSDELKKFKARVKSRHETFNARLKIYDVLGDKYYHDKEKFPACMEAVAILVQFTIADTDPESAEPLGDV